MFNTCMRAYRKGRETPYLAVIIVFVPGVFSLLFPFILYLSLSNVVETVVINTLNYFMRHLLWAKNMTQTVGACQ